MTSPFAIDVCFPGGNAIIEAIDGDTIHLRQDQRQTTRPWFYWQFAVRGAAGRTLRFVFTDWDVIGERGPCLSSDGGRSWRWLGRHCVQGQSFTHTFADHENDARLCFCIPYHQADLDRYLASRPNIRRDELCRSPHGRAVELLQLGPQNAERWALITCRHHACESPGNFALEGLLDRWTSVVPNGVQLLAIPFVDKDGVEEGDQGKGRDSRDHNRDYRDPDDPPRYPEVAAIMRLVERLGPPTIAIDLHAPWIRGAWSDQVYLVGVKNPATVRWQRALLAQLAQANDCFLPIRADDFLPVGEGWNTPLIGMDASHTSWMIRQGVTRVTTMELPYAVVHGETLTADGLRSVGRCLAAAVTQILTFP